jgi:hypothetical protein
MEEVAHEKGVGLKYENTLPITTCSRCGLKIVRATSGRTGNQYSANVSYGQDGAYLYSKASVHECQPEIDVERYQAAVEPSINNPEPRKVETELSKGTKVEVVKGRKYPKGTKGEVFWVASKYDGYGVLKAGVRSEDGEKLWINVENLKILEKK